MRKLRAIGIIGVGVLTLFLMPTFASAAEEFTLVGTSTAATSTAGVTYSYPVPDSSNYYVGCLFVGTSANMSNMLWNGVVGGGHTGTQYLSNNASPYERYELLVQAGGTPSVNYAWNNPGYYTIVARRNFTGTCNDVIANKDFQSTFYYDHGLQYQTESTLTRIILTDPRNGELVSTTTTTGAIVYVNEDDWVEGTYLNMNFVNNTIQNMGGSALDAWNAAFGGIQIPLEAGYNNVSTTTTFDLSGQINASWRINQPNDTFLIGNLLPDQTLVASSTVFTVNYLTALDIAMASTTSALLEALLTGTTTPQSIIRCNPLDFDIMICLISLIIPPQTVLVNDFNQLKDGFLSRFPVGYVTRFVEILSATTTVSLPTISYTVGSTSPLYSIFNGDPIEFDPFAALAASTSPLLMKSDQAVQKNFWEVIDELVTIIVYLTLIFMIVHDITGVHKHHKKT